MNGTTPTEFPLDGEGKPLAWPDPHQPVWYLDAWNGVYDSREEALNESAYWTAVEDERVLAYGEGMIDETENERRRAAP